MKLCILITDLKVCHVFHALSLLTWMNNAHCTVPDNVVKIGWAAMWNLLLRPRSMSHLSCPLQATITWCFSRFGSLHSSMSFHFVSMNKINLLTYIFHQAPALFAGRIWCSEIRLLVKWLLLFIISYARIFVNNK